MAGGQERILRNRIRAVQATKKITRAMELIAASRIVKAQARVAAAVPYADRITDVGVGSEPACRVEVSRPADERANDRNNPDPFDRDRRQRHWIGFRSGNV